MKNKTVLAIAFSIALVLFGVGVWYLRESETNNLIEGSHTLEESELPADTAGENEIATPSEEVVVWE